MEVVLLEVVLLAGVLSVAVLQEVNDTREKRWCTSRCRRR